MWYFPTGGQIRNRHRYRGAPKSLHFDKFTILSLLFLPPRGAKLHSQLRWGTMAGFAPLDPPLHQRINSKSEVTCSILECWRLEKSIFPTIMVECVAML